MPDTSEMEDRSFVISSNEQLNAELQRFKQNNLVGGRWNVNEDAIKDANQPSPDQITKMIADNSYFISTELKSVTVHDIASRRLSMVEACKLNIRRLKSQIQYNEEFYLSKYGNSLHQMRYTPLVLRRLYKAQLLEYCKVNQPAVHRMNKKTGDIDSQSAKISTEALFYTEEKVFGIQTCIDTEHQFFFDGDQFTFKPQEVVTDKIKVCDCFPDGEHNQAMDFNKTIHTEAQVLKGQCPNVKEEEVSGIPFQLKHNIGSWNCNACMINSGQGIGQRNVNQEMQDRSFMEASTAKFTKATKWCPNFIPVLGSYGVSKYRDALSESINAGATICFGGIMHIQVDPVEGGAIVEYKCDTCGMEITEKLDAQPDEDVETTVEVNALVTDEDNTTAEGAESKP